MSDSLAEVREAFDLFIKFGYADVSFDECNIYEVFDIVAARKLALYHIFADLTIWGSGACRQIEEYNLETMQELPVEKRSLLDIAVSCVAKNYDLYPRIEQALTNNLLVAVYMRIMKAIEKHPIVAEKLFTIDTLSILLNEQPYRIDVLKMFQVLEKSKELNLLNLYSSVKNNLKSALIEFGSAKENHKANDFINSCILIGTFLLEIGYIHPLDMFYTLPKHISNCLPLENVQRYSQLAKFYFWVMVLNLGISNLKTAYLKFLQLQQFVDIIILQEHEMSADFDLGVDIPTFFIYCADLCFKLSFYSEANEFAIASLYFIRLDKYASQKTRLNVLRMATIILVSCGHGKNAYHLLAAMVKSLNRDLDHAHLYAMVMNDVGKALIEMHLVDEASIFHNIAFEIIEQVPVSILHRSIVLEGLAYSTLLQDLTPETMALARHCSADAYSIGAVAIGDDSLHVIRCRETMALSLLINPKVGDIYAIALQEALHLHKYALCAYVRKINTTNGYIAKTLGYIGSIYQQMRNFGEANDYFCRAIEMNRKLHGEDHHETANAYSNLAFLYLEVCGYYKNAFYLLMESLQIKSKMPHCKCHTIKRELKGLVVWCEKVFGMDAANKLKDNFEEFFSKLKLIEECHPKIFSRKMNFIDERMRFDELIGRFIDSVDGHIVDGIAEKYSLLLSKL